jgi:hypothetical protein
VRATLAFALVTVASAAAAKPAADVAHVAGKITADAKLAKRVKSGGTIFVFVYKVDGNAIAVGTPLAATKLRWSSRGVKFHLSDEDALMGHPLTGDVLVLARFDQDGDAISRQAGDVEGHARATVSADGVKVVLDELIP